MPGQDSNDITLQPLSRRPFVQNVLPFLTSLAFHGGMLVLGFVVYQSVKALNHPRIEPPPPAMPPVVQEISTSLNDGFIGDQKDPSKRPQQALFKEEATGVSTFHGTGNKALSGSLSPGSNSDSPADMFIGAGPGGKTGKIGFGTEGGEPGSLAAFGNPQSGGGSHIFNPGRGPAAHSVIFLCDASGSMLSKFSALRGELNKAVTHLKPVQSFGITFFGETRANAMAPQLVMATPENQHRATNFLEDVTPRETTDPLPAIELAFKQKPQLIFFLTDGDFPDNEVVLNRIRELNKDHGVKINTIAFVNESDTDTQFIALLKKIADDNGGIYSHVTQDQVP